jgi:GDPmannose 4,6-dehydratase
VRDRLTIVPADPRDPDWAAPLLRGLPPLDEIYHLAAQSIVARAWDEATDTVDSIAMGTLRLLDAARRHSPRSRIFVASSSAVFGDPAETPQRETTPHRPLEPYGAAKSFVHTLTGLYRDTHGLYAVSGLLFNHESPRRGSAFVTRKIAQGVARIAAGETTQLALGSLDARRDWGFAGDYVDGMWRALQATVPTDYAFGTGAAHSVREFCERAFAAAALDYRAHVVVDERFLRAADDRVLVADATRAREVLGWVPHTSFERLVAMMVEAELARAGVSLNRSTPNA